MTAELDELDEIEVNEKMLNYHMGEEYDPVDGHGKSCCYWSSEYGTNLPYSNDLFLAISRSYPRLSFK